MCQTGEEAVTTNTESCWVGEAEEVQGNRATAEAVADTESESFATRSTDPAQPL